jgi:hypothetical protein
MGLTICSVFLAIGAYLTISLDTPRTGVNLQTMGLFVMLVAMTAMHVVLALRDSAGNQTERREPYYFPFGPSGRSTGRDT